MFVQHARLTSYKICSFNQKYRNKSKIMINKRDYLFYYLYVENTLCHKDKYYVAKSHA